MSIKAMPTLDCNFRCKYCYEDSNRHLKTWNPEKMKDFKDFMLENLELGQDRLTLHGGEVTNIPFKDFKELLKFSYHINGQTYTSLQTNGFNITEEMIEVFKEYNTDVGVSIDGPWPINSKRGKGSLEQRRKQHEQIMNNIKKMRKNNINVSIISIINENHMNNSELFIKWVDYLKSIGIKSGRFNLVDDGAGNKFSYDEAVQFYKNIGEYMFKNPNLNYAPIRPMIDNLLGFPIGPCTFSECDINATPSCKTFHSDLTIGNCLHPARFEEKVPVRNENTDFNKKRLNNLQSKTMDENGCADCKYYPICKGGCPAMADNPIEERSNDCQVHYRLYKWLEKRIKGMFPFVKMFYEQDSNAFENIIGNSSTNRHGKKSGYSDHTDKIIRPEDAGWEKADSNIEYPEPQ